MKRLSMVRRLADASKKGFSLLELLVVISIIAILVGLSAVSYSTAQKKARDARRRGDMRAIQAAYEQYYADPVNNSAYPPNCSSSSITTYAPGGWPTDPQNSTSSGQVYTTSCDAATFCFCSKLESGTGNSGTAADATCSGLGVADGNGAYPYFCVKNQQ